MIVAALLAAGGAQASQRGPWWAPDHAKLQLAGNLGFLAPGVGWAWRRVDSDLFLGWVPARFAGDDLFMATGKVTFRPWTLEGAGWRLRPFTASTQLTYTFGDRFTTLPAHDLPPTALRAGIGLGAAVGRRVGRTVVELYAELVALDVGLYYWITDPRTVGLTDVFSVAFGVRVEL